jgi:signal peptidase I
MQTLRAWSARRRLRREAWLLLKEAHRVARRFAHRLSPKQAETLSTRAAALERALRERGDVAKAVEPLVGLLEGELAFTRKSAARQYVESIGGVVFVALLLRSFVVEAYQIPSGSMIPTLQVGDHIFVNKLIYGVHIPFTDIKLGEHYREPRRGEIIVFEHPKQPQKGILIKRVIAVGGDQVQVMGHDVFVNGQKVPREREGVAHWYDYDDKSERWFDGDADTWSEQLGQAHFTIQTLNDTLTSFAPRQVPQGNIFVMGDNRDNSDDSRFWGFVPLDKVRGRAMFVWWSIGKPEGVRMNRFGHLLE